MSLPNDKFKFVYTSRTNQTVYALQGVIDEDTNFEDLMKHEGPYIINFKGISSINSCGVRSWVNFMKRLDGETVIYEECPPIIVRQMNMVPSFTGNASVESVFVPYICDSCESEKLVLVNTSKVAHGVQIESSFPCESCKKDKMVVDGQPEQYFAFRK